MALERGAFSRLLANLMRTKPHQLIWVDETTYSSVQSKQKSWSKQNNPQLHVRNARQMRVTVIGAIGTCLESGRLMQLARSTNKQDFMAFLHNLKQAVLPRYRAQLQIVVYDGAAAHTCQDSQDFMHGYFIPL